MRGITFGVLIGCASLALLNGTAFAAEPNNQACLGHDISGYAQGGVAFGEFISTLASGTEGVGTEVQAHLAGLIPDSVIPNTCNDPS